MQRTKPPNKPRRVSAADIKVVEDGETYYPHVGEWVEFRGRVSLGLYLDLMDAGRSRENLQLLLGIIHGWTLTDDNGQPVPLSLEGLLSLPQEELSWLIANAGSAARTDEEALGNA